MAAGSVTPLSLAYLIEISFVINLAYHELNTFKFRDSIREKASGVIRTYRKMWDGNETLVQPEWGQLKNFHTGEDSAAWEGKWLRWFYCHLIYSSTDRKLARILLFVDVLILAIATWYADSTINLADSTAISTRLWEGAYAVLLISIIVPAIFMWVIRQCKIYVDGCIEEDTLDSGNGRLHDLDQKVLIKIKAIANDIKIADSG